MRLSPLSTTIGNIPLDSTPMETHAYLARQLRDRARAGSVPFETPSGLAFAGLALVASARRP